jgi:hypothetical protein
MSPAMSVKVALSPKVGFSPKVSISPAISAVISRRISARL